MNEVFGIEYGQRNCVPSVFSVTESADGTFGICNGGAWVELPSIAYEPLHNFLAQQLAKQSVASGAANPPPQPDAKEDAAPDSHDWQCGDDMLRAQLALALVVREPKLIGDPAFQRVIEDMAYEAGKRATRLALSRLMPGVLDDFEMPF